MTLTVNGERLRADLERLARFGRRPDGSVNRPALSPEDGAARRWFADRAAEAGLAVRIDGLLNVLAGTDPVAIAPADQQPHSVGAIWTGSHLDTVPDGGMFDGALGAMAGLECARRLVEEGIVLAKPVVSAAFSDEEGAFMGFLGSKGLATGIQRDVLTDIRGADGRPLVEALSAAGGSPDHLDELVLGDGAVSRFVELHVEQGPRLEAEGIDIGVVTGIVGIRRAQVIFTGNPDHAGTTPMYRRRDALRGAGALLEMLTEIPARAGVPDAVVTCGRVAVHPGADNVVPDRAVLHLDMRHATRDGIAGIERAVERASAVCGARHGLEARYVPGTLTPPVEMDPTMIDLVDRRASELGYTRVRMPSGAGHDAQVMAEVAPTGMIFVPSQGGRSHSRWEHTAWPDVVRGANVLLQVLIALAADAGTAHDTATATDRADSRAEATHGETPVQRGAS